MSTSWIAPPLAPIADETAGAEKLAVHRFDLESGDFSFFDRFVQGDTDGLFITAGFGRLALFEDSTKPTSNVLLP